MGFQQPQVTLLSLTLEPIVIHPNGPRAARGAANDPDCIPRVTMVPASIATAVPVPPAVTAAAAPDAAAADPAAAAVPAAAVPPAAPATPTAAEAVAVPDP